MPRIIVAFAALLVLRWGGASRGKNGTNDSEAGLHNASIHNASIHNASIHIASEAVHEADGRASSSVHNHRKIGKRAKPRSTIDVGLHHSYVEVTADGEAKKYEMDEKDFDSGADADVEEDSITGGDGDGRGPDEKKDDAPKDGDKKDESKKEEAKEVEADEKDDAKKDDAKGEGDGKADAKGKGESFSTRSEHCLAVTAATALIALWRSP